MSGFTPNLSPEQITELDRRRGQGDLGTYTNPDGIKTKKPWLNADGTHKAQDEKTMSKTNEAIQMLKSMRMPMGASFAKPPMGPPQPTAAPAIAKCGDDCKGDCGHNVADKLFGKSDEKEDIRLLEQVLQNEKDEQSDEDAKKALSSQSMHVLRPMGAYDPFNVMRSATQIPLHRAPIGETASRSVESPDVYKSCAVHGITFRAASGCHPCTVQKSTTCSSCGDTMVKSIVRGGMTCPRGH